MRHIKLKELKIVNCIQYSEVSIRLQFVICVLFLYDGVGSELYSKDSCDNESLFVNAISIGIR